MAPAALDTIFNHFSDTGLTFDDYDLLLTGDLGVLGSDILRELLLEKGIDVKGKYMDCGSEIFEHKPDVHQGGSGAGCSAVFFNSFIYDKLLKGEYKSVLFVATGAMLSTLSSQQGDSIPAIAHAVGIFAPIDVLDEQN